MLAEIVLPHGTTKIVIRDIPGLIADAIYPPVPDGTPKQITELRKYPLTKQNAHNWCGINSAPFPVSLTDADLIALQAGAWKNLPKIKLPMPEPDWEQYRIAVDNNPPDGWRLEWLHKTPEIFQMWMHHTTMADYAVQVRKAAMSGILKPLSSANYSPMPSASGELLMDCIVTLENFTTFANSLQFGVTVKTNQLPIFHAQARPLNVPPELETMSATAQIRIIDRIGGGSGEAINTVSNYREILNAVIERQSTGYFTVDEAAQVLADTVPGVVAKEMIGQMLAANQMGKLPIRNPGDKLQPLDKTEVRAYVHLVSIEDVNTWLASLKAPYCLRPEPAAIGAAMDATKPPEQTEPQPLPTNTIAQLFDGISFPQDRWVKNIGQAKWLASANRGKGEQGGAPATWCPLTIARLVCAREKDARAKQKTLTSLNSRFRNNPVLKPWKDAWDDYYGMFTEPGEAQ